MIRVVRAHRPTRHWPRNSCGGIGQLSAENRLGKDGDRKPDDGQPTNGWRLARRERNGQGRTHDPQFPRQLLRPKPVIPPIHNRATGNSTSSSQPQLGFLFLAQALEFACQGDFLDRRNAVHEQHPIQVIHFMLDDAGQHAAGMQFPLDALDIKK